VCPLFDMANSNDHAEPTEELAEQRRHPRTPVTLLVDYDGAADLVGDYTHNISQGGMFVSTRRALEPETEVKLILRFPGLLAPVAVEGVVRWMRDGDDPGVGIELSDGPGQAELAEVVERIRAGDPSTVTRLVRILVVEDNPHVSQLIRDGLRGSTRRMFADLAFNFRTASNGREALETLANEAFDMMIIDIYLPILDGAQVIAAVRDDGRLAGLPVIAVSAGGEVARTRAMAAGADMFLDKPMRLREVIATMRSLMHL
jgi:uncharacterized protein (TIGR02266 family)